MDFLANHYISICVAVMAATLLFIHFNLRDRNANKYIAACLLVIDLLPASMAVSWATTQNEGLTTFLFVLGFIAFASLKLLLVWLLLRAMNDKNTGGVMLVIVTMLVIYGVILAGAAFNGNVAGAKKAAQASLDSAPMQSIEAQILSAETKLEGLAKFADGSKASAESTKTERLKRQLNAARTALSNCKPNYITLCIRPNTAKVDSLENQLSTLTYYAGNSEYTGTIALLATLQERRAKLMESGGTVSISGTGADDRFLSKLFGGDVEQARNWKTLIFMIVFDFITIGIRMVVAFVNRGVDTGALFHEQYDLMRRMGHSHNQVMLSMSVAAGVIDKTGLISGDLTSDRDRTRAVDEGLSSESAKVLMLDNDNDMYLKWLGQVQSGDIKCTQKDGKRFISSNMTKGKQSQTITPQGMVEIHKRWLNQATNDGVLLVAGGIGKPSHVLA